MDKKEIREIILYTISVLEMVIDFILKVSGFYIFFYRGESLNGAIILGASALWTIMIMTAKIYPLLLRNPNIMIQIPEKLVIAGKETIKREE